MRCELKPCRMEVPLFTWFILVILQEEGLASNVYVGECTAHPGVCVKSGSAYCANTPSTFHCTCSPGHPSISQPKSNSAACTEVAIFTIRPKATDLNIPPIGVDGVSVAMRLSDLVRNATADTASVTLVLHENMWNILEPNLIHAEYNTVKTFKSDTASAIRPKPVHPQLPSPITLTVLHSNGPPQGVRLSCVLCNNRTWNVEGCDVTDTNSTHTVCTCVHPSTFVLIMQTGGPLKEDRSLQLFNTIFMSVGLFFLALAIFTFALCRRTIAVNMARLNLSACLFLAQLLFLLTQNFLYLIHPHKVLCSVLSGFLHFLYLCAFTWMHLEAVTLFLLVRKLKELRAHRVHASHWAYLHLIGYGAPLLVVGVAAGIIPDGHGSKECWLKVDRGFTWSFVGPVIFILLGNTLLFLAIFVSMTSTLAEANNDLYKIKETKMLVIKTFYQFVALGCPWILGLFASRSEVMETLFLLLASQQGTFIFLIHCVLNEGVQKQLETWRKRLLSTCKQAPTRKERYTVFFIASNESNRC